MSSFFTPRRFAPSGGAAPGPSHTSGRSQSNAAKKSNDFVRFCGYVIRTHTATGCPKRWARSNAARRPTFLCFRANAARAKRSPRVYARLAPATRFAKTLAICRMVEKLIRRADIDHCPVMVPHWKSADHASNDLRSPLVSSPLGAAINKGFASAWARQATT
jgi:hypothetical protein